jgi:hypothetical protein
MNSEKSKRDVAIYAFASLNLSSTDAISGPGRSSGNFSSRISLSCLREGLGTLLDVQAGGQQFHIGHSRFTRSFDPLRNMYIESRIW